MHPFICTFLQAQIFALVPGINSVVMTSKHAGEEILLKGYS